jgi:hypothetical protein
MHRKTVPALVLAIGLLLAAAMARNPAQLLLMRLRGSVVPSGSGTLDFGGKPVTLVNVYGHPGGQADGTGQVAAYHMIVLFSAADSVSGHGRVSQIDQFARTTAGEWWAWSGPRAVRRTLVARYDGLGHRVEIGGRRFPLSAGNLFVARFDERGRLSVRQLARTMRTTDLWLVAQTYHALLPSDPIVANMLRAPQRPCPKAAPRASAT